MIVTGPWACPLRCPCAGAYLTRAALFEAPPAGEIPFRFSGNAGYCRELLQCAACRHIVARHDMDTSRLYRGDYVTSNYGDDGIAGAFNRIIALDPKASDNAGRVERVHAFALTHGVGPSAPGRGRILDVGSGLCVFLHGMKAKGWICTALDPDLRSVRHAEAVVGVRAVCADFMQAPDAGDVGTFEVVTFNKVLEHVQDPVAMLLKARANVAAHGFAYIELPDGETALGVGPGREEFFIDHWHAFSMTSMTMLAERAGFRVTSAERLHEPSGKYTLIAFLAPAAS